MHTQFMYRKQRGSVLILALTILMVLTVLGISAMSGSNLQERMAGNTRDYEIAFQSAEAGLRAAENYINSISNLNDFSTTGGTGGKYTRDYNGQAWKDNGIWPSPTTSSSTAPSFNFIIQELDTTVDAPEAQSLESVSYSNNAPPISGSIVVFQITARGYGLSTNSRVMLQSYYGKAM